MPTELWETGIGQVITSRKNNQDEIAIGIYLIDVFCLGIKNCFIRLTNLEGYKDMLRHVTESCGQLKSIEPVYANTLIYKASEYARQFGFKPHADFVKAKNLLKNIPLDEGQLFTFGKDGKPCYIQGPNESPGDVKKILKTLESNQGSENYHFVLEVPDPDLLLED